MQFPAPPLLKTTIIQLNKDIDPEDNNYEILTNEYSDNNSFATITSHSPIAAEDQPRKKRRRSSSFVDEDELVRRRNETKQLHSIIEKRRRIKINREFEALKYIIPACRSTENSTKRGTSNSNNNGNKIDGMYKLTILKAAVEYILYLHFVVQKQHSLLDQVMDSYNYDVAYSKVPLDVNQYRNIDKEFDFGALSSKITEMTSTLSSTKTFCEPIREHDEETYHEAESHRPPSRPFSLHAHPRAKSETFAALGRLGQLPTPNVTPDIAPILSVLSKYAAETKQLIANRTKDSQVDLEMEKNRNCLLNDTTQPSQVPQDFDSLNKTFLFEHAINKSGSVSSSTSPFTIPIKSQIKKAQFYLPDPALSTGASSESSSTDLPAAGSQVLPKKMYFKSKVPPSNLIASVGCLDSEVDIEEDLNESDRLKDASKTLLTLRKPSIEKLLN